MSYLTYFDVEPMEISEVEAVLTDSETEFNDFIVGDSSDSSDDDFRCFSDDDGGHSDEGESGGSADAVLLCDSDPDSERGNIAMSDD